MDDKINNDKLTKEIHGAILDFMREHGSIHLFKCLAEICCFGERTGEHRLVNGGWTVDEVVKIVQATRNTKLILTINQLLKGE